MPTEKRVPSLIVNTLTEEQYQALENPSDTEMWVTPLSPDSFLPSQTGQSGKFLTTNGTTPSWAEIPTDVDNKSVSLNSNDEIQTVGVIDQNDTTKAIKTWTGTKAQYEAIATKDADTIYNITDDTVLTDFANTSLSNLTNAGKIVGAGLGMPSDRYIDLTLGATDSTYTATSDGYIVISGAQNGTSGYVFLTVDSNRFRAVSQPPGESNYELAASIPVKKGQTFIVAYARCTIRIFRFIYAEGSKSEANQ